jgi:glycosyltransferase involved in cell wall biosynthesis
MHELSQLDFWIPNMIHRFQARSIAFVGNYIPRNCGIATFTHDMFASITGEFPDTEAIVVAVNDRPEGYDYPAEVRFTIDEQSETSYLSAAEFLNGSGADVVSLQHEFGIYGGDAGDYVLSLLQRLHAPVVTTFHTVLDSPDTHQRWATEQVCDLSARVVVMTERGRRMLREIYGVPGEKIALVAHGIPDVPFTNPDDYKDRFQAAGRPLILTFGLLAPNKGIEFMLKALPEVVGEFPNVQYLVLGATHPNLVREEGEDYRLSLEEMARGLGVEANVRFHSKFVELNELTEFLAASDIYVTPYLHAAQITSGTLAYAFGCGKAVISTPYWHAEELLAEGRGVLVPFEDSAALGNATLELLRDEKRREEMRTQAYRMGRAMIWEQSARNYMAIFTKAIRRARKNALSTAVLDHLSTPTAEFSAGVSTSPGGLPVAEFE